MRTIYVIACVVAILIFVFSGPQASPAPHANKAEIARGEYLVNYTSMCDDCHTEHDARGLPIKAKHLQGAKIGFKPNEPLPPSIWADTAPPIAGLTFLSDQEAVTFFTSGKMPDGKLARAPMAGYRFSPDDSKAVTAYLKSLSAAPK